MIALDDVSEAVSAVLAGVIPNGFVGDLVEDERHSLRDVMASNAAPAGRLAEG